MKNIYLSILLIIMIPSLAFSQNTGTDNTYSGTNALVSNTTGSGNSAFGKNSLLSNTTGFSNSATGGWSLSNNTTGSNNSAIGRDAGRFLPDGVTANQNSNNSNFFGMQTSPLSSNDINETVVGYQVIGSGSNTVTIGNSSVTKTVINGVLTGNGSGLTGISGGGLFIQAGDNTGIGTTQNVGVGTVSAINSALTVNGNVSATSYTSNGSLTGQTNYLATNVGIGTFTVPNALQVAGTAAVTGFQLGTSTTSGWVLTANSSGVGSWAAATGGSGLWTTINTNDVYEVNSGTYGNVGIGTTLTNLAQLRILKNSTTDYLHIDSTAAGAGNLIIVNNAGNVGIGSAVPGEALDIESGNVGIGTHSAAAPLVVTGTGTIGLTTTGNVGVGTYIPTTAFGLKGVISEQALTPTISACGTSPNGSAVGNDQGFTITVGGTATGCVATFTSGPNAGAYYTTPSCTVTNQSMSITSALGYSISTSAITITQAVGLSADKLNVHCDFIQ